MDRKREKKNGPAGNRHKRQQGEADKQSKWEGGRQRSKAGAQRERHTQTVRQADI